MKKSYFWGLLLAIMALIPSQNAFAEYCTMSSTFSNSDRHLDSFTLTDGVEELAVSSVQPNSGSNWWPSYKVYNDHTSKSLTTQPGATLYFKSLSWTGSWMHGYVFIDYNQDETFDASEAVSYNFYSEAGTDTGVNSKGESVSNNCGVTAGSMPSWTLPTDLASGTYRLRLKIDWNSLDACGASDIVTNRGCIADITLNVEAAIPERTIDVTVTPEGAGTVTGAGTAMGNITLVATPTPGYEFVNWTLNGEVVSTEMSYTDATEGNKSYVANFAALTAYPEMSYFYTNGANQANRYLKEVVATAGETVTTVFSATTEAELPKVDPDVIGSATTQGAYVDKTENPIIIPEGTTEFTVNFKAWTAAMTISGESATTQLQWTQQAAFIDWNNNFCFYEEGENYGKSSDTMGNDGGVCQSFISETGYTRTFSVPAGVQPGVYRMRVCYFEPDGNNAQQWQNTIFEKGNCTTRNGKTYDFAIEVIGVTPETPVYAVSVSTADEAMGTAEVSATEVEEGTEVTFTATAAEGYQFVNWTSGEEVVSTENPYTVAVTAEMALTANFELIPVTKYAVSVATADEAMGTAEVSATEVEEGTEVTFTATAAEGYQFVNWTSGEEVVSTENPYTVAVTAEMTLTANFELIPVTKYAVSVTTVDGAMGTAEVSATEVKEGEEVTFTATANLGYKFIGWLANGETVSTENPYTTAVTAEMSLVANFEALTPAIVLTATPDVERQFVFEVAKAAKILIDWGDGDLVETEEIGETYPGTEWIGYYKTTVNGTVKGEGEVKIYGDITYFDCSYSSSYSSKVTSLDVTNATSLLELNASSNEITTLDLSNNTALYDLALDNNTLLTSLILPSEGQLNSISALSCALTTLDLTSSTSLTSLVVNDNPGLGSLDLSANTALTQLKANNTGLTAIDLSANTALNALYLNNNQLTTLDVSKMDKGAATRIYVYAKNNNLTEFITSEQVLLSSTRIYIDGNAFTLATLPAITGINAYNYAPQQAMTIATEITEGEELDLSSQAMVGENATVYTWYTAEGEEFTGYTVEGGKFVFNVEADTELYCTMTNASFDKFSGANAFKTTNIVVKNLAPAIVLTATPDVERQFVFEVAKAAKILIDWGDGDLVETEEIGETYPGTEWIGYYKTTVNGTVKGEGEVKIYGDITYFDCSYSSSYSSKVTSLDVTNATSLLELNASSNEITTLDLSNNTALYDLALDNNTLLTSLILPSEGQLNSISALSCALTTLDLTSSTSLTSLVVNDNPGLGSLDLSANTALTQLKANNTGLTAIDLSANTALNALYLNNNQLTTLDVSKMDKGAATRIYVYAKNNNLTEFITSEQVLLSSTRIYIDGNAFTLATLPAITGINAYNYAPQQAMRIATEITEGEELDLSSQAMVGENATVYTWYTAEGEEFTNYTVEGGKFVFDVEADTELYCTMTNASFDKFSGANAFKTTNILVKYVAPTTYTVTVTTFDGGTVAIQGYEGETAQIEEGTQVTVVATPAEGFEFVSWTDADDAWDTDLTFNAEYTFTVTRDINLKAWFSQLPVVTTCQVLVNIAPTEDYGTVVIEGVEGLLAEVEVGTEVTAVATPAEGKIFEGWFTFVGDELSTNATYTFTATEDVVVVAWFTDAPEAEYCTYEGKSTHSERRLNAVTITDGTNSTAVSSIQPYFRGDVYVDKTDVVFPSYAGATVNFSDFDFKGEWMHAYVYIDYNNDKVFDTTVNADGTTGGELVAFTFYSETDSGTGVNSLGETVSNYTIPMVNYLPAFTLPADLEKGEYRVRVKTDWCHLDPCGHPTESANKLTANGACIADFTMSIDEENGVEFAEADGAQVYAADGVIYINGYEGDVKVVNVAGQVVKDVNVNGNDKLEMAAGLYMVVTGDQVTKVVVK